MTKQKTLQNYPMPDSTAIESRLLNMLILHPYDIDKVGDIVREDMFQDDRARDLWRTLKAMSANHEEINFATISTKADREYFVNGIIAQPQDIANDPIQVAHSLVDTHIKFLSYISAMNILTKVTTNATCAEIIDEFKALPEAVNNSVYCDSATTAMDAAKELQDEIAKGAQMRVSTTITMLDGLLNGGLCGGQLAILAARPSVGKTQIGLQMMQNLAMKGERALIFSLEMSAKELARRLILGTGHISAYEFYNRKFSWEQFDTAVRDAISSNLVIMDKTFDIDSIIQKIKVECNARKCRMAMIDYLGLISVPTNSRMNLASIIGEYTRKIKLCAKECDIPILLLAQLNRSNVGESRSPQLHDLRDSGSIEQDADIVMMLEDKSSEGEGRIDLWLRKNRAGRRTLDNAIRLQGDKNYSNFKEI